MVALTLMTAACASSGGAAGVTRATDRPTVATSASSTTVGQAATTAAAAVPTSSASQRTTTAATRMASTTTVAASTVVERLGCSVYCQNAGGYGGGGDPLEPALKVTSSGTVAVLPDGTVPISVSCLVAVTCRGALILGLRDDAGRVLRDRWVELARSDLLVEANQTAVLGVPLTSQQVSFVIASGLEVDISGDGFLTATCTHVVAPRHKCTRFNAPPSVDPTTGQEVRPAGYVTASPEGDGMEYLIGGSISLAVR